MKRERSAFLIGGLVIGALAGYFVADAVGGRRAPVSAQFPAASPAAPAAGMGGAKATGMDPATAQEIGDLRRILEQNPKNAAALVRLANLFHDAGLWTQAIAHYERALAAGPGDADVWTDLGICYRGDRQFERALEAFEKARRIDPGHWKSLFNTAVVAGFDLGRLDEAERAVERLEQVNPSAPNLAQLKRDLAHVRAAKEGSP